VTKSFWTPFARKATHSITIPKISKASGHT
jgi:hypothetical protein